MPDTVEPTYRLVLDFELERPGCVIIQAAYGADGPLQRWFPAESWLTAPTPGMRMVEGTAAQFAEVAGRWA